LPLPCPECGAATEPVDDSGAQRCPACGLVSGIAELPCPACGVAVSLQSEACPACGEPLTLFGQVMSRHDGRGRAPVWLSQARGRAADIRRDEDAASRRRFETLEAIDRRRIQAEEQAARTQTRKDRRVLLLGLALGMALAVGILVLGWVAWAG